MPDDDGATTEGTTEGTEGTEGAGGALEGDLTADQLKAALADARKEAAKYRTKARDLEPFAAKGRAADDASKSAEQKLTEATARAERAESNALRLEVAFDKGLAPGLAKRLAGATRDELEADAEELLAFSSNSGTTSAPTAGRPREDLKAGKSGGGRDPEDGITELDHRKLAAKIPRSPFGLS